MRNLLLALAVLIASPAAPAEKAPKLSPDMRAVLAEIVGDASARRTPQEWSEEARNVILSLDMDGGGFSARDIEIAAKLAAAQERLRFLSSYLRCDLDGDGLVTTPEYKTCIGPHYAELEQIEQRAALKEKRPVKPINIQDQNDYKYLLLMFAEVDTDGDGTVSLAEAYRAGAKRPIEALRPGTGPIRYLVLDLNHDGVVVADEIDAAMAQYWKERAAGDWEVRKPKASTVHFSTLVVDEGGEAPPPPPSCPFPSPRTGAKLVRIGIYKGTQISSIALAGQNRTTTVVTVEIEPGREPLYLVASQYEAVIWKFTGAVERIDRFVVASNTSDDLGTPAAGAVGLPADKMAVTRIACIASLTGMPLQPDKTEAGARMIEHLGRTADVTFGVYDLSGVKLPSATPFKVPEHRPAGLQAKGDDDVDAEWRELLRFGTSGVAEIDPRTLVSLVRPERYETLPKEAGLIQLLIQGKIAPLPQGGFLVQAPIRYPPGLNGSHSVRFVVKEGVPAPVGGTN